MVKNNPITLDNIVGVMHYHISKIEAAVVANDRAAYRAALADVARSCISSMVWADDYTNPMTAANTEVSHG